MPDYKQDFLVMGSEKKEFVADRRPYFVVMGSAENRVFELAVKLCAARGHQPPRNLSMCAGCREEAGIR